MTSRAAASSTSERNASTPHRDNVSRDPRTIEEYFARVSATLRRRLSDKNPTFAFALLRTAEHTTTSASLP